jgi:hypothetical protein
MSDLLKSFWSKLYAWALPSALALGAYWLLVYPKTHFPQWLQQASDTATTTTFVGITVALAFCLNALSTPLYRILEGYLLWPIFLQKWGAGRQLQRKHKLRANLNGTGWKRNLAVEKLAYYPLRDTQVAPTRFGNALRAFETYGKTRFNLDSQTLWYELLAVAPKYIQDQLDSARATVDFFVASVYLSAAFCVVTLAVAFEGRVDLGLMLVSVVAFGVMLLCHWMLVRVTRDWSLAVQALVNVGRKKLAETMGFRLSGSLDAERRMWGRLTQFVFYGSVADGALTDAFRKSAASNHAAGDAARAAGSCTAAEAADPETYAAADDDEGDGNKDANTA